MPVITAARVEKKEKNTPFAKKSNYNGGTNAAHDKHFS